jgi:hypothetical protein
MYQEEYLMPRHLAHIIPLPVDKTSAEYKQLSQLAKDSIFVAEQHRLYSNLMAYYTFLDNMKFYQEKHLPEHPHLLDGFYSFAVFQRTQERNLCEDGNANYVFELMQNLSAFVNIIPKDNQSWLYEDSRASFLNIVLLTQTLFDVAQPMNTGAAATGKQVKFQERMASLSSTVASTTDYIQHRFDTTKQNALVESLNHMRLLAEGRQAKEAKDHPLYHAFLGILYSFTGLLLAIGGALICTVNPIVGAAKMAIGAVFLGQGSADLARSWNPYIFFGKEEKKVALQSAATGASLYKLSSAPSALFSATQKLPKSVEAPSMVELQGLVRTIRI